jgi:regulator of sigma E protease
MLSFLVGIAGWVLVPTAVVAGAYAALKLAARFLLPDFRLLVPGKPGTGLRRFAVRAASTGGAFLVAWFLAFAAARSLGKTEPTMTVRVHEGPAKRAGLVDGDRIVAVDDRPVATWHAMRDAVRAGSGGHTVTVERDGQRVTVAVTPDSERRIGVEQHLAQRPASVSESFVDAFAGSFLPIRTALAFGRAERRELSGPVGIARQVRDAPRNAAAGLLWMLAAIAAFTWPVVFAFHALDALLPALRRLGG